MNTTKILGNDKFLEIDSELVFHYQDFISSFMTVVRGNDPDKVSFSCYVGIVVDGKPQNEGFLISRVYVDSPMDLEEWMTALDFTNFAIELSAAFIAKLELKAFREKTAIPHDNHS